RHLEPVLHRLVREGILKGTRGPHGGYKLGRSPRDITADDILRGAAASENGTDSRRRGSSALLDKVVSPAIPAAEGAFSEALSSTTLEDLVRSALAMRKSKKAR